MSHNRPPKELIDRFTKHITDKQQLVQAGWTGFKLAAYPDGMVPQQAEQLRDAFFAGAQHLYSSIMSLLEPGQEPTEADLNRMSLIAAELDSFLTEFKRKHHLDDSTKGNNNA